jgi:hypothetical protein
VAPALVLTPIVILCKGIENDVAAMDPAKLG